MKTKVAIVGGGFGGISAAKKLSNHPELEIHLIDRRNHHLFQPLLYQVAMAGLNPSEISVPIRKIFSKSKNVVVTLAEVEEIDESKTALFFDSKWHSYDKVILACGAKHSYFGNDDWETFAPGLKNIEQATEIRRRILTAFELAEKEENEATRQSYLTFVVIGGGPTGVELAGAISEIATNTLIEDYKRADLSKTKVYLIEAGPRILAAFPESLSRQAEQDLASMGVSVLKNTRAKSLSENGLQAGETFISAKTLLWAAGVRPSSLILKLKSEKDSQGRVKVLEDLSISENKNIFAIGDNASFKMQNKDPLPGIAPVAIQQGSFVADQILRDLRKEPRKPFRYWDKGIMATIGRSKAVVSTGKINLTGFVAWLAWVFIHLVYLMKFRNRVFVFLQWTWGYFTFGQGARLIVHKSWRFYSGKKINYNNDQS